MSSDASVRTDVLVLGGGFAGARCAQRLEKLLPRGRSITLVSSENYFVFQPLLPEVVGASLEPSHVISPLRHLLRRTKVVCGEVRGIELSAAGGGRAGLVTIKAAGVEGQVVFEAAHIVLALGSTVDVSRIPGMAEQSFLMKNVADALALRHAVISRLEGAVLEPNAAARQALLTFVVVGGGFSGVETAAEINDLVRGAMRFFPSLAKERLRVVCVHSRAQLLPELDTRLGTVAQRILERRGVEFRLQERTRAVSREGVYLGNGELLPTRTVVCTIGNAPNPILQGLAEAVEGRLPADDHLRLVGRTDVWTLGDCAHVPDGHGGVCPPTAQFATRQGDVAAQNIAATLAGRPLRVFQHKSLGQLATLGHLNAVAAIGRLHVSGFLAWWLWRTVYLMKLPRLDRKLRVVIDWTLNLFFPRDLNSLGVAQTRGHTRVHLEAGETLFAQGDPSAAFYVVETGSVQLTRCDAAGCVVAADLLGPGDHFGEGSLLRAGTRTTTAVAQAPTTVLAFPAREFSALTQCFRGLRKLLEASSRRFQPAAAVIPAWVPADKLSAPVVQVMSKVVVTLREDATLQRCLQLFLERRFNSFPIVDAGDRLVALVTSTDLFAALRRDVDLQQPVLAFATRTVRCMGADEPIERAVEIMRRSDVRHVMVTDGERRVVGVVSMTDILRLMLADAPPAETAPAAP